MQLQCVAVCFSVLQSVAVCRSVLQCVAVRCSVSQCVAVHCSVLQCVAVWFEVDLICRPASSFRVIFVYFFLIAYALLPLSSRPFWRLHRVVCTRVQDSQILNYMVRLQEVCCSVLQVECCSVLQVVCLQCVALLVQILKCTVGLQVVCCSVLQVVCCSVLQIVRLPV